MSAEMPKLNPHISRGTPSESSGGGQPASEETVFVPASAVDFSAPVHETLKTHLHEHSSQTVNGEPEITELQPHWQEHAAPEDTSEAAPDGINEAASDGTSEATPETDPIPQSEPWPRVFDSSPEAPSTAVTGGGNGAGQPPGTGGAGLPFSEPDASPVPQGSDQNAQTPERDGKEFADKDEDDTHKPMTLMDHLSELRVRLVRCLLGSAVGFLLCYGISELLFKWLAMPLVAVMPQDAKLMFTSVPEGFFVYLKVAFVAGVFVASPYLFYQVWAFVAPGLYQEEKNAALPLAFCSAFFFILGASFCYFLVFPYAFAFFMSYSNDFIVAMPSINEYLGFSLKMLLAFGLIFEMPLFAFFLARMGIITAQWLRSMRRYAVLVIFIVAAILTPPDVISQMLMAIPMLILYEVSIFVAQTAGRAKKTANTEPPKPTEGEAA